MIYTVTLSPALDYMMWLDHFEEGGLNRALNTSFRAGGKGINVSVVLSRLGISSVCLGFTAGFVGQELIRLLTLEGIDHDFITAAQGCSRINVKVKSGTETEINADGPVLSEDELNSLLEKARKLKSGDVLILSGKPPKGIPDDIYSDLLTVVSGKDVKTVVDASGDDLLRALDKNPYRIKPNKAELEEICRTKLGSLYDIAAAARELQQKGARSVLVSLGADGALLASGDGKVFACSIPEGELVNSTGAGDSMVAGFIARDLTGGTKEDCLRFAVACGSASSYSYGLLEQDGLKEVLDRMPEPELII